MMKTLTAPSQKAEASTTELAGGVAITSAAEVPANMAILLVGRGWCWKDDTGLYCSW
jgi:hypothetical protein